jgi:hypothetical protein
MADKTFPLQPCPENANQCFLYVQKFKLYCTVYNVAGKTAYKWKTAHLLAKIGYIWKTVD